MTVISRFISATLSIVEGNSRGGGVLGTRYRSSTLNQPKVPERDRQHRMAFWSRCADLSSRIDDKPVFRSASASNGAANGKGIELGSKHHSTCQALRFQDIARSDARPQSITSSHRLRDTVRLPTTVVRSEDLPSNTSAPRSSFSTSGRQEPIYQKTGKPGFYFVEMVVSKVSGFMRTGIQDIKHGTQEVDG
jgi:hypothetical protein